MGFKEEILKRRTFGIISHPDAGKTTLTEKLLLFGGAIHVAGAVKSNKIKKTATSDFMEIERQRGISVATSVMGFEYKDVKINILDTPGHQDFAEDTFRVLTACDSVIIVVDSAKGVETQTRKLMQVCRMRKTPVIVFINKLDRPGQDPFDLLDEIEKELQIQVTPLSWPIGNGDQFKGIYNIHRENLCLYSASVQTIQDGIEINDINSGELDEHIGERSADKLREDLELVREVYPAIDRAAYLDGASGPRVLRIGTEQLRYPRDAGLFHRDRSQPAPPRDGRAPRATGRGEIHRFRLQDSRQHGPQPPRPHRLRESVFRRFPA